MSVLGWDAPMVGQDRMPAIDLSPADRERRFLNLGRAASCQRRLFKNASRHYFGSIPHAELVKSLARRIVDKRVLHLIKMWLECAVEEIDDRGRKKRTTEAKDSGRSEEDLPSRCN